MWLHDSTSNGPRVTIIVITTTTTKTTTITTTPTITTTTATTTTITTTTAKALATMTKTAKLQQQCQQNSKITQQEQCQQQMFYKKKNIKDRNLTFTGAVVYLACVITWRGIVLQLAGFAWNKNTELAADTWLVCVNPDNLCLEVSSAPGLFFPNNHTFFLVVFGQAGPNGASFGNLVGDARHLRGGLRHPHVSKTVPASWAGDGTLSRRRHLGHLDDLDVSTTRSCIDTKKVKNCSETLGAFSLLTLSQPGFFWAPKTKGGGGHIVPPPPKQKPCYPSQNPFK